MDSVNSDTMDESFTKHLPFLLLAKNLKKTKIWRAILKSFWDFLICKWSLNNFDPVLFPLASAFAWTYLQLPLWQWGAGNVYLLVLTSWKVNIAENPIAVMGL